MLESVQLGTSGLSVSQLCLGTMNFGIPGRGHQGDWTLTLDEARPIFKSALDHGLYYFDCADVYGLGASEEVVGALLNELLPRDEYVLATKIAQPMGRGANQGGLSRKHVMEGVDACLKRLGHDYIDHLVIHRHPHGIRGQHAEVPIEETMEALNDVVVLDPLHQEPHMDLLIDILPQKAKAAGSRPQLEAPSEVRHHFTVVLLLLTPCV